MAIELDPAIPILRIFDIAKARTFYVDYLGFTIDMLRVAEHKAP